MKKRIVCINECLPHRFHSGGGITAYTIIRSLVERGNDVFVLALDHTEYLGSRSEEEHIAHLKSIGVKVDILPEVKEKNSALSYFDYNRFFPALKKRKLVKEYLSKVSPSAIFMYHWNSIASVFRTNNYPKLGVVGDPSHLPVLFRREFMKRFSELPNNSAAALKEQVRFLVDNLYLVPHLKKTMKDLLNDCTRSGAFAAHHAQMFEEMGVPDCRYFRTPVPDPLPYNEIIQSPRVFKIMHIGHLQGIATLSGLELLATGILPGLLKKMPASSFEIHVVGGFFETMPAKLKKFLNHPNIKIRGPVYPSDKEFLSSGIVLVPTPIELGIRVRIITAFSYGSCIVAHSANKKGIPELEDGKNCLLGNSADQLADLCAKVYNNPQLQAELSRNARKTYEKYFSPVIAGGAICETIEKIAK